jgi:hypothetical protein
MNDHHFSGAAELAHERADALVALAYELLDAHADTARLATGLAGEELAWELHLHYLQDLQRAARERLARLEG